jgi:uncharacterized protein (DUF58 family)
MLTTTPAEILRRIRKIEILTRNSVSEIFRGEYHSSFKGQGLEFAEVREYQPGDSFRSVDWNVSARLGYPYVKLYKETRELNILFIVDISASQDFGTREMLKKERVAELVALLSFSAVSNNDKIGMVMFSSRLEKYLPPRKGRNRALELLRDILYLEPVERRTDLASAFEYASLVLKKRSVVFILSDFQDSNYEKKLRYLASKHDVIALQVLDSSELELPKAGVLGLVDPETGHSMYVNTSDPTLRKAYAASVKSQREKLAESFRQMRVDHLLITSTDSSVKIMRDFFERRKRQLRKRL